MPTNNQSDLPAIAVAATALAISASVLIVAIGQTGQQYLSTPRSNRRCQAAVMGPWAAGTKARFLPFELRYQTVYQSPRIVLQSPVSRPGGRYFVGSNQLPNERNQEKVLPSRGLLSLFVPAAGDEELPVTSRASWLALLDELTRYQSRVYRSFTPSKTLGLTEDEKNGKGMTTDIDIRTKGVSSEKLDEWFDALDASSPGYSELSLPAAEITELVWDFMPSDLLRPYATISLGDLLIIGHRIGLEWTAVNPLQGVLQAQDDHGNIITSTQIRSLGTLVTFIHDERDRRLERTTANSWMPSPSQAADKLVFGIIPGDERLGLSDVRIMTDDDCLDYAASLSLDAKEALQTNFQGRGAGGTGFDQLMPLISPCLILPDCRMIKVRKPHPTAVGGILQVPEGYVVFLQHIQLRMKDSATPSVIQEQLRWIMSQWDSVQQTLGIPLEDEYLVHQVDPAKLAGLMSRIHKQCTNDLQWWAESWFPKVKRVLSIAGLNHRFPQNGQLIKELVRVHMMHAFRANIPMESARDIATETFRNIVTQASILLASPVLQDEIEKLIDTIEMAWYVLIFRALVFNRSCIFEEPTRPGGRLFNFIPAEWYDSKIPIYIG